jgi:hypothetical protein
MRRVRDSAASSVGSRFTVRRPPCGLHGSNVGSSIGFDSCRKIEIRPDFSCRTCVRHGTMRIGGARTKLFEHRREMANYALKRWTQSAIARQMRISQATVSRDLASRGIMSRQHCSDFVAHSHDVVAHSDDVVAHKRRFCATRDFVVEFCVSRTCVRAFSDFRAIAGDGVFLGEERAPGDSSAGPDGGSGEDTSLAVKLPTFEKLRKSATRDR